jgi:hypothetical protein
VIILCHPGPTNAKPPRTSDERPRARPAAGPRGELAAMTARILAGNGLPVSDVASAELQTDHDNPPPCSRRRPPEPPSPPGGNPR